MHDRLTLVPFTDIILHFRWDEKWDRAKKVYMSASQVFNDKSVGVCYNKNNYGVMADAGKKR